MSFDRKYYPGLEDLVRLRADTCYETNLPALPPSMVATPNVKKAAMNC